MILIHKTNELLHCGLKLSNVNLICVWQICLFINNYYGNYMFVIVWNTWDFFFSNGRPIKPNSHKGSEYDKVDQNTGEDVC